MIDLTRDGDVFVLRLDAGQNRFHPDLLDAVGLALDEVGAHEGPKALVTTGAGKFYSNGLDLDWVSANGGRFEGYLRSVHELFAKMLELDAPTVAAVNGHAFAGGAMLALTHDEIVMRSDRGYVCLPEVDLGMTFTPGMNALLRSRLSVPLAHELMIGGRRYGAEDARAAGFVRRAVPEAEVLPGAVEAAAAMAGRDGAVVGRIRRDLYREVLDALRGPALPPR